MNKKLPLERRIHNAHGSMECDRLHGIHQLCALANHLPEDYNVLFQRSDDCGWGFTWGWLVGWREMYRAMHCDLEIRHLKKDCAISVIFHEATAIEQGVLGFTEYNELNSGVVEVADDGKTARAAYISHGICYIHFNPNGKRWGNYTTERYGADFIYDEESKRWMYLHELVAVDGCYCEPFDGSNACAYEAYEKLSGKVPYPGEDGWDVPPGDVMIDLTLPPENMNASENAESDWASLPPVRSYRKMLHYVWSPVQPVQPTTYAPPPYATMDYDNSYMPADAKINPDVWHKDERGYWNYDLKYRFPEGTY